MALERAGRARVDDLLHQPNTQVAEMMRALKGFLGVNDMMAYLTMMGNRLLKLHWPRIYGTRTPLPDGRDSRAYLARLHELESEAKSAKRGGWRMGGGAVKKRSNACAHAAKRGADESCIES